MGPLLLQLLVYPVTDYACSTESHTKFAHGYLLASRDMQYMWNLYIQNERDKVNQYASVLRAESHKDLPPALVVLAEYDVLYDEGYAYAQKLQGSGVPTMVISYPTIHGFINFSKRLQVGK